MTTKWLAALAVSLAAAAGARAQPPATLPMPAQVTPPSQAAPSAAQPGTPPPAVAAPAAPAPGGPGCCGREHVSCLKQFCNWITYHPLTRGCECVCGCGCCSDCCGYHGFQPIYTHFLLPCQEAPHRPPTGDCASCGGHGLLGKYFCKRCHGGPIVPPGIE